MYHEIIFSPHKRDMKEPKIMNGPKGTISSLFLIFSKIKKIPVNAPKKNPRKSEIVMYLQPKKAPTIAASSISPIPIDSFLKIKEPAKRITNIIPPPITIPKAEFTNDIYGTKKLKVNPIIIPGKEITSGITCSFKSIKAIITRADDKIT